MSYVKVSKKNAIIEKNGRKEGKRHEVKNKKNKKHIV